MWLLVLGRKNGENVNKGMNGRPKLEVEIKGADAPIVLIKKFAKTILPSHSQFQLS